MKKILILVPDGTGIKNYLYSNVFKNEPAWICLFHNFDTDTLNQIKKELSFDKEIEIPQYKESFLEKFYRELICLCRLSHNSKELENPTILKFWKKSHKGIKLKVFYFLISIASKFVNSYKAILKLEEKYNRAIRKNDFYEVAINILKQQKPDVLFCTHQRSLKAATIFAAARDLNIKTTTVIYSWDNIPKARLALRADQYLVWSWYMKKELQMFYPEISETEIRITGTPQFEFYSDPKNIIEKEQFYKDFSLDSDKKLICFSGDDIKTSPYDSHYLNDLAEAMVNTGLDNKVQIIFRRCPVDVSDRYDWVLKKFEKLIVQMPPLWNFNSQLWTAIYPTYDDVKCLVSLAYYADAVVNVGSTMAFDFGMFQKPCIYINYDHVKDNNWSVKTIYNYQHFRSMPWPKAVFWLNDHSEIADLVTSVLDQPRTEIKEWFDVVVEYPNEASENIIKELV